MKNVTIYILIGLLFNFSIISVFPVGAEEITISGNGSESVNTATASKESTTQVNQSNNATITNNIQLSSNTGNNSTSHNSGGESTITTGDTNTNLQLNNTANTSILQQNCCPEAGSSTTVSGNGAGSTNNATTDSVNNTSVTITNNAVVTNTITGWANTGGNNAKFNNGDVSISTGNIYVGQNITNGPINVAEVGVPSNTNGKREIAISKNGAYSENNVQYFVRDENNIFVNNSASILNDVSWKLNTGKNMANHNIGNVDIETGDILTKTMIKNGPINVSTVKVQCCEKKEEPKAPPPPKENVTPSHPSNPVGGNGDKDKEVLAAVSKSGILPATGNSSWLFFATIANMMMFMLGLFIRLRSGRSPGLTLALS